MWQKYVLIKQSQAKNAKKSEGKKVAAPGFEPGSLDPKSKALTTELRRKQEIGAKNS